MTSSTPPFDPPDALPDRPELPAGVEPPPPHVVPGGQAEGTPARSELPAWPPWAPFAGMLLTLVIAIAGATAIGLLAMLAGADLTEHTPAGVAIGGTLVQHVGLVVSAIVFAGLTGGPPTARQFGLRRVGVRSALGWLVAAWVGFYFVSGLYAALFRIDERDELPDELGAGDSTLNLVLVTVIVCVVAPIAEELFFRGFCFTALRRWLGLAGGALATGVIFGLIHAPSSDVAFLAPLALLGVILCLLYHRTGSILPCMALHALNNALAMGVAQNFPAAGTVALMIAAPALVASLGFLAASSRRLNPAPAAA